MKLTRIMFLALAFALPTSWTIAHAEDAPAAAGETTKKEKKAKRSKDSAAAPAAEGSAPAKAEAPKAEKK